MKIRSVVAELFYADGRTDKYDEADSRFFAILRSYFKYRQCEPLSLNISCNLLTIR